MEGRIVPSLVKLLFKKKYWGLVKIQESLPLPLALQLWIINFLKLTGILLLGGNWATLICWKQLNCIKDLTWCVFMSTESSLNSTMPLVNAQSFLQREAPHSFWSSAPSPKFSFSNTSQTSRYCEVLKGNKCINLLGSISMCHCPANGTQLGGIPGCHSSSLRISSTKAGCKEMSSFPTMATLSWQNACLNVWGSRSMRECMCVNICMNVWCMSVSLYICLGMWMYKWLWVCEYMHECGCEWLCECMHECVSDYECEHMHECVEVWVGPLVDASHMSGWMSECMWMCVGEWCMGWRLYGCMHGWVWMGYGCMGERP